MCWLLGHLLGFSSTEWPSFSHLWRSGVIPLVLLAAFRLFLDNPGSQAQLSFPLCEKERALWNRTGSQGRLCHPYHEWPIFTAQRRAGRMQKTSCGDLGVPNLPTWNRSPARCLCILAFWFNHLISAHQEYSVLYSCPLVATCSDRMPLLLPEAFPSWRKGSFPFCNLKC